MHTNHASSNHSVRHDAGYTSRTYLGQDIYLYIVEFSASAALARLARLDADPRVLAALAAAYDNDYRNVLAGRNVDDIVCVTKAYDKCSTAFRFCNIYPNARAAIAHGYLNIAQMIAGRAFMSRTGTVERIFKAESLMNHPCVAKLDLEIRIQAAINTGRRDYIDTHYDYHALPPAMLYDVIRAGARCAMKYENHIGSIGVQAYAKLLIEHGEFAKCRELLPRLEQPARDIVRCRLAIATGAPADIDEISSITHWPGTKLWVEAKLIIIAAAMANRVDILARVLESWCTRTDYIIDVCIRHLDEDLCIDLLERVSCKDSVYMAVCSTAMECGKFAVFKKYWRDEYGSDVFDMLNIDNIPMAAIEFMVSEFGIDSAAPAAVCKKIAQCDNITPYEYILDQLSDADILGQALRRANVAQYAVRRGVRGARGACDLFRKVHSEDGILYMPGVMTHFTFLMLYAYCAKVKDFRAFTAHVAQAGKYAGAPAVEHAVVLGAHAVRLVPGNIRDLVMAIVGSGDIKCLKCVIEFMRAHGAERVIIDELPSEFIDLVDLINKSSDVIVFIPSNDEY